MHTLHFNPDGLALARRAASEGMVLLKNDRSVLPLDREKTVALFGRNQTDTFKGGGGAADLWAVPVLPFASGMEELGNVYAPLLKKYRAYSEANHDKTLNKIWAKYTFSLPEVPLTREEVSLAASSCETAVIFLGRFAGESIDLSDTPGEYRITDSEEEMLRLVTEYFKNTVLVLNLPGLMDLSFVEKYHIDAILQAFLPGIEAGHAIADVLYGTVTPCGKLPDTWAGTLAEYPTNEDFATERIIYSEDIYMGYRYFDTFEKDVMYPFGYGLSYTSFSIKPVSAAVNKTTITIQVSVTNTGSCSGREIVQCYLSVPEQELEQPYQILCGFEKTSTLMPGQEELLTIQIHLFDFTSYSETLAAYLLEKGTYILRAGSNSRDTAPICRISIDETVIYRQVKNRLVPPVTINPLKKNKQKIPAENIMDLPELIPDFSDFRTIVIAEPRQYTELPKTAACTFADVLSGKNSPEELAALISDEDLALMLTGDGDVKRREAGLLPDEPVAWGEGSHSHPLHELGIPSSTMQDGPAGVRASSFFPVLPPEEELHGTDCIAYPCATLLAATWDRSLMREIGEAISVDLDRYNFNGLCAPGVNLHRNPLCGRNFEYFSEDPWLSAQMAVGMILGVEKNRDGSPSGRYAVLKHFACNESEQYRLESDSIVSERCLRELYLRAFELVIQEANPLSVMTSYNILNGTYASANYDLLTGILRTEWNYTGWVMTDWDVHADPTDCLKAGIDIVMPGRYVTFEQMTEKGLTRALAQQRIVNLIRLLTKTKHFYLKCTTEI